MPEESKEVIKDIDGEPCFPIYKFRAYWIESREEIRSFSSTQELPPGCVWNFTSFSKMWKEEPSDWILRKYLLEWWDNYYKKVLKPRAVSTPILSFEFLEYEVWCLTWFEHYTFDIGQDNREVLVSFDRFIQRKTRLNSAAHSQGKEDVYCLMGAEDRWRWHGAEPYGERDSRSEAPCRCRACKSQGVIRISH